MITGGDLGTTKITYTTFTTSTIAPCIYQCTNVIVLYSLVISQQLYYFMIVSLILLTTTYIQM